MRRRRRLCPWSSWKPPKLLGHSASIAVYSTVACDARHRFGEYVVEHAEHVSIVIAKNYSRRASLARLVPWDRVGTSRRLGRVLLNAQIAAQAFVQKIVIDDGTRG